MIKIEERIFCSDWDKATFLINYEEQKIKRLLQAELKQLDDPARYTLFEALVHGEYYYSLDQLGGSLLEFGFKEKLSPELLQSKAMCLTLFDISSNTYSTLYCKPSLIQKSIFLDDVAPTHQDLEVHNLKEIINHFVTARTTIVIVLFYVPANHQSPVTPIMPNCGDVYSYCLRFINIKSPISYSELEVGCSHPGLRGNRCVSPGPVSPDRRVLPEGSPAEDLPDRLDRQLRGEAQGALSARPHDVPRAHRSLKKNIVIEFNNKCMKKIFLFHLLIGSLRYLKHSSRR
jgi:hypothetical protein